ncbi:MAG: hypothetical protein ACI9D5_002328 [Candidatus Endobugula sp.]|jgi:hypothetical protein
MWLFYIPVVAYIICLVIRYRGLSFTAVNPGMPGSGFIGENKSLSLLQLQRHFPDKTAKTLVLPVKESITKQLALCSDFMRMNNVDYPIVLKPDFGQRGIDVEIVHHQSKLRGYLENAVFDSVLQEYIEGVEFGVFYMRHADEPEGKIFSLTHKCFPAITGDGVNTVETLICEHPRLHYMAAFLLAEHESQLQLIPKQDEQVNVVSLGSHCRGSLFLEGEAYGSEALSVAIEALSCAQDGFYFGRYDVRASDIAAFQQGDIKVIEVNGVTSESTNIYDPKYSVFTAYRVLFQQWHLAFTIGKKNILQGARPMTINDLIAKIRIMNHGV